MLAWHIQRLTSKRVITTIRNDKGEITIDLRKVIYICIMTPSPLVHQSNYLENIGNQTVFSDGLDILWVLAMQFLMFLIRKAALFERLPTDAYKIFKEKLTGPL